MTEKKFHDFRVIDPEPHGRMTVIWLDDIRLLGVTDYQIESSTDDLTRIRLTMFAGSLNKEEPPPGKTDWVIETETKP